VVLLKKLLFLLFGCFIYTITLAQTGTLKGVISQKNGEKIPYANIYLANSKLGTSSEVDGTFQIKNIPVGEQTIFAQFIGFERTSQKVMVTENEIITLNFILKPSYSPIEEVVISGTMKEMSKSDSPVPVEVYSARYFENNKAPSE
jgi:outer membrane receptor for ferrienterochelin and colicins